MQGVFLDRATIDSSIDLTTLENCFSQFRYYETTSPQDLVSRAVDCEVIITNKVVLNQAVIEQLPNLKLICVTATGTNNIDLVAAENRNIKVANVAGYSTHSVAQHVFAYLLNFSNQVDAYQRLNQTHPWHRSETFCQIPTPIHQLSGLRLGIIGFGNIGQTVAKIGESFGMKVIVAERPGRNHIRDGRVSFDTMVAKADVISIHCPLTEETQHLFEQTTFSNMKSGAVLINTARGPIVDSEALAQALKSGQLAHAIIDVLEQEPPESSHPLMQDVPNLTLTHHIAWGSIEAQQVLMDSVVKNIQAFRNEI